MLYTRRISSFSKDKYSLHVHERVLTAPVRFNNSDPDIELADICVIKALI